MQRIRLCGADASLANLCWEARNAFTIGRDPHARISLHDISVSRLHAEVAWVEPHWVVRDLGSTNGTFVNGQRVGRIGQSLRLYDVLQIGGFQLIVVELVPERPTHLPASREKPSEGVVHLITGLVNMAEGACQATQGHGQHVAEYALLLARELRLGDADSLHLELGASLHDVGNLGIVDSILSKSGPLTPEELELQRSHPLRGVGMVDQVRELAPILGIIRNHHERWDGTGYPDRLAGEAIPLLARVVSVADAFDAMTSERPYRAAIPWSEAFAEIARGAGGQFDPRCVTAFLGLRSRLERLRLQRESTGGTTMRVELEELAFSDPLTELPNRTFFEMTLRHALTAAATSKRIVAVLFADLDGFKLVNDTWGHAAGDSFLQVIARRLKGCVRERDIVARLGGDEFALVLGGLVRCDDAVTVARKIASALSQPCVLHEGTAHATVSIGIAFCPNDATDPQDLVKKADLAMYRAKNLGKDCIQTFRTELATARVESGHE